MYYYSNNLANLNLIIIFLNIILNFRHQREVHTNYFVIKLNFKEINSKK